MPRAGKPNEVVERAARAAYEALVADTDSYAWIDDAPADMSDVTVDGDINLLRLVRAVIAAMRDPTEAMLNAAVATDMLDGGVYDAFHTSAPTVYRAMIDEALK